METRKFIPSCALAACSIFAALTLSCSAAAIGIGEAMVESGPGEPLSVRVELFPEGRERIEDACLSLLAPDPLREDIGSFLTGGSLSLSRSGERQFADIRSLRRLAGTPLKLRLQVKCPGTEGVIKTLVISSSPATGKEQRVVESAARSRRLSAEEGAALLARQDELEAALFSMQQQFRQLQDEFRKMKVQQAQERAAAYEAAQRELAVNRPLQFVQRYSYLLAAIGLVLLLALWLSYRIGTRLRAEPEPKATPAAPQAAALVVKQPFHAAVSAPSPITPSVSTAQTVADVLSPLPLAPAAKPAAAASEEDSLLEEAGLYAASGRQARAVEILQDIVRRHPSKTEAWPLLLSLYSSMGKAAEFESAAREFQRHHKDSPAWSGIQALGRTLDHDNPLYASRAAPIPSGASSPHHQIGDLLVEMGILSRRDMLGYLDEFDPRKHGRFGGYLVARKAISLAQLDRVLLQQQGVGADVKPVELPSLQNIENFLADFDPKRHGSVSEFMASHNAGTPEQLGQLFRQPPVEGGGAS